MSRPIETLPTRVVAAIPEVPAEAIVRTRNQVSASSAPVITKSGDSYCYPDRLVPFVESATTNTTARRSSSEASVPTLSAGGRKVLKGSPDSYP